MALRHISEEEATSPGADCGAANVNASAATWNMLVMLACNIPTLFVAIPLGRLADMYGRRRVLIWNCATQSFGSLGMLLVPLLQLDLIWYIPTYLINGLGGGSYVFQSILLATLTDTVTASSSSAKAAHDASQERTRLIGACTALTYFFGALGPLLGGYLTQDAGPTIPHKQPPFRKVVSCILINFTVFHPQDTFFALLALASIVMAGEWVVYLLPF